jgi:D-alanyl-D-alanine carboxypeptidase
VIKLIAFIVPTIFLLVACTNAGSAENRESSSEEIIDKIELAEDSIENVALDFELDKDFLLGRINQYSDPRFEELTIAAATRENIFVLKKVAIAFTEMQAAAKADGTTLKVLSGTRNFSEQKRIWERKWNGQKLVEDQNLSETIKDPVLRAKKIMEYSSMPGTSRHHWGTDIDINSLTSSYFTTGKGKTEYEWLLKNAVNFGFCQTYTDKASGRTGYNEEEWHWTYFPISSSLSSGYSADINYADITGFEGSEVAEAVQAIAHYVLGVNKDCVK